MEDTRVKIYKLGGGKKTIKYLQTKVIAEDV